MRNALHEQLLKAGLIDEQRLENLEKEKSRARAPQHANASRAPQQGKKFNKKPSQAWTQVEPKAAPNPPQHRPPPPTNAEEQAARRARERELAQIIKANRRPHNDGEEVFNFVDGRKIGRIYVTPAMQAELTRGELAIVRLRTRYAVVPTAVAATIAEKAPELVILRQPAGDEAIDQAYLEHPIPDDLRW